MGQPSRKERRNNIRARELRLQKLELRQQAVQMAHEWKGLNDRLQSTMVALLTVLAQKGGEIEVTKGTLDQVLENLPRLGWKTEPKPGEEEVLRVLLHEAPEEIVGPTQVPTPDNERGAESGERQDNEGNTIGLINGGVYD